jgi:RluA family pseudouridine synthase
MYRNWRNNMKRRLLLINLILMQFAPFATFADTEDVYPVFPWNKPLPTLTDKQKHRAVSWVIYQDKNLIIINKPKDITVNPTPNKGKRLSVQEYATAWQGEQKDAPVYVHRLDNDTSGVLVLARTKEAHDQLRQDFAKGSIHKTYLAILTCEPKPASGEVNKSLIIGGNEKGSKVRIADDSTAGKKALTIYKVIATDKNTGFSFVELSPQTGRTHQLRVHMQSLGCPILGDRIYGGKYPEKAKELSIKRRLYLHAHSIKIPAFNGSKEVSVTAPLPDHMKKALEKLKILVKE